MESSEFYSELKAKGLQLANHDGKLRVGPVSYTHLTLPTKA